MDLALLNAVFDWVKQNKEGFWEGTFVLFGFGLLWMLSKLAGKGKAIAGGVLDTYSRMSDDLKKSISDERADMKARLDAMREDLESTRAAREAAEAAAEKERETKLAVLAQMAAVKEALAREGEIVVTLPDGSVQIKPASSVPSLKDL